MSGANGDRMEKRKSLPDAGQDLPIEEAGSSKRNGWLGSNRGGRIDVRGRDRAMEPIQRIPFGSRGCNSLGG